MGTAYALGLADVYRRAGRPVLTAELLRHAMSLLDETKSPEKFAQVRQQLSAVEDRLLDEAGPRPFAATRVALLHETTDRLFSSRSNP